MAVRAAPGPLLRHWRQVRHFSQLDLALRAEISTKHLSFVETGRSRPSPEMITHLCAHLDVPLRDRNEILLAAGYAPSHPETDLTEPGPSEVADAIELILHGHAYPALAVDGAWNLVSANEAASIFLTGVSAELLTPPINVVRLSLHPDGLAPRVVNFEEYAAHALALVRRTAERRPNPVLDDLLQEFGHLAHPPSVPGRRGILVPLVLRTDRGELRLFSTITSFGTPHDVALDELAVETFYPADPATRALLENR